MRRYAYKKTYVWSPDIAYLTGLIASDGCLIGDGRHLNITSKDIEIINFFQNILNMKAKVVLKFGQYNTQAYHLSFSNVALYDFLLAIGLTPKKSLTIDALIIPDRYYPDFLRGYFDGDGTVYGYWDKRWKNSLMFYTGFVSASPKFLNWLQISNQKFAGVSAGRIKPNKGVATLTYAKRDSRKLFDLMYYDLNIPKLSRKHLKFIDFLERDPYANVALQARVL